jgi:hypothetical protein
MKTCLGVPTLIRLEEYNLYSVTSPENSCLSMNQISRTSELKIVIYVGDKNAIYIFFMNIFYKFIIRDSLKYISAESWVGMASMRMSAEAAFCRK